MNLCREFADKSSVSKIVNVCAPLDNDVPHGRLAHARREVPLHESRREPLHAGQPVLQKGEGNVLDGVVADDDLPRCRRRGQPLLQPLLFFAPRRLFFVQLALVHHMGKNFMAVNSVSKGFSTDTTFKAIGFVRRTVWREKPSSGYLLLAAPPDEWRKAV